MSFKKIETKVETKIHIWHSPVSKVSIMVSILKLS